MIQDATTRQALPAFIGQGGAAVTKKEAAVPVIPRTSVGEAKASTQAPSSADRQASEQAVARVRHEFQNVELRLKIEIDPDLDRAVVKVMDGRSGEIIRQIPPEEMLKLAKQLSAAQGFLIARHA